MRVNLRNFSINFNVTAPGCELLTVVTVPAVTATLLALLEPAALPLWVLLGTGERPGMGSMAGGAVVLGALAGRALWLARLAPQVPTTSG